MRIECDTLVLSLGLLLVYMYGRKYAALSQLPIGEPYVRAFHADMATAVALPMWIVALATIVISHSLFLNRDNF